MKKILLSAGMVSLLAVGSLAMPFSSFAAGKVNVIGKAKIVLQGTATPNADGSLKLHVVGTTGNAKKMKNTDVSLKLGKTTKVTKSGKKISVPAIAPGSKVKVWAIYDKKSQAVSSVTWVKIVK